MIGILDADLLDGCGHMPNLALMQIAGTLRDRGLEYRLIASAEEDLSEYERVYLSKVFTFTRLPKCYTEASEEVQKRVVTGGTGFYAMNEGEAFMAARLADFDRLQNDKLLSPFYSWDVMPDYDLYKDYVQARIDEGAKRQKYKYFLDYSLGFLTRGCVRHCPFCVNRHSDRASEWSRLEAFHDKSRPYVCFLDDNFLAAGERVWKPVLMQLAREQVRFQFRQGLDIRLMTGTVAALLKRCKLHGDMIFAFDRWADRELVNSRLGVWRKYFPKKSTKLYLFCGYRQQSDNQERFLVDVLELFWRLRVLIKRRCLGYVMRHEDYKQAPIPNFYVQVARWVNQPAMFKTKSFMEFCELNGENSKAVRTVNEVLRMFPEESGELEALFYDVKWDIQNKYGV